MSSTPSDSRDSRPGKGRLLMRLFSRQPDRRHCGPRREDSRITALSPLRERVSRLVGTGEGVNASDKSQRSRKSARLPKPFRRSWIMASTYGVHALRSC
jgi:hypothetical protein